MRDRYKGTSSFTLQPDQNIMENSHEFRLVQVSSYSGQTVKPSHRIFHLTSDPNFAYFNTIMYTLMNLCKNEKLLILRQLLHIEKSLFMNAFYKCKFVRRLDELTSASIDDQERYLKMAMRLDSNDPAILHRKKKEIIGE